MRLFVAVYPPDAVADDLAAKVAELRIGQAAAEGINARLAGRPGWHVTLAFLGEVDDGLLDRVCDAVGSGVVRWLDRGFPVPNLRVAGGGRFGRGRFTVLWAGLTGDVEPIRELAESVRQQLKRARIRYDGKPSRPHLTIARPGDRLPAATIAADLADLAGYDGPQWSVDTVELVRSHLGPRPQYDHLEAWSLAGPGPPPPA